MSLVVELSKLQERKEALLREVALIDRELNSVADALGARRHKTVIPDLGPRPPRKRAANGESWQRIEFWLRAQATAQTYRQIAEGTVMTIAAVQTQLTIHKGDLIHRGNRWGVSESQFADHSADLEDVSRGDEGLTMAKAPTSPTVPLMNGATDTSSALTTTESTALVATEPVNS